MPSEFTPRYNLAKPNVNGLETENVWGYDINLNFDKLDAAIIKPAELFEAIEDQTASLLRPGANISLAYNDAAGTLTITGLIGTEQIDDRVAALIKAGPLIGLSYNDAAGTLTISNLFGPEGVQDTIYDTIRAGNNVAIAYDEVGNRITIHSLGPGGSTGPQNVFDTIHDARLAEIPAQLKVITLSGYNRPGDGGPAMPCRRTPAMVTRHKGVFRTADRYREDGFEDAVDGGWWEYVGNNGPIWLEWFGGLADYFITPQDGSGKSTVNPTRSDNCAAIKAAAEFLYAHIDFTHISAGVTYTTFDAGPTIQLGYGGYFFADTLKFEQNIVIHGMGQAGWHNSAQSRMMFPAGKKGIIATNPALTGAVEAPTVHQSGILCMRYVFVGCEGHGGQTDQHGIEMNVSSVIEHSAIHNFGGNGIDITADIFSVPSTNSNLFYLNKVSIYDNKGDGVYCQGGDSNAGIGIGLNCMTNGGWGINDQSFLGNTWIGAHTQGNILGPFRAPGGGNQRTLFLGCYSESDQPPSQVGVPAMMIGGIQAADAHVNGFSIIDDSLFPHRLSCKASDAPEEKLEVRVRAAANNLHTFTIAGMGFAHRWGYDPAAGAFVFRYGDDNATKNWAYAISTEENKAGFARPDTLKPNNIAFPNGIYVGGEAGGVRRFATMNKGACQSTYGPGHDRPPGAYETGDVFICQDAGQPFQPNYAMEYCYTRGVSTPEVWASGTAYNNGGAGRCYIKNLGTQYYRCMDQPGGGAPSTVQPTHTGGTEPTGDGYLWRWIGNQAAVWKGFGDFITPTGREADDELRETINALQARVAQLEATNGH